MEKKGYFVGNVYQGGYSTFESPQENYITAGSLGLTTDPRSANILKETSAKLSSGVKQIELALVTPQIFDSIPKQQLQEVRRLSKLTGVDVSIHGPVIDTTGITQQGFSELNREDSERRIIETLNRSNELNPKGNSPVTFHSAEGIPGSEWKTLGKDRKAKRLIVVDRESGKLMPLEEEKLYYPELKELKEGVPREDLIRYERGELNKSDVFKEIPLKEGQLFTPEHRVESINQTSWDNSINQLIFNKERADDILQKNQIQIQHLLQGINSGQINPQTLAQIPEQFQAYNHYENAKAYLEDLHLNLKSLFSKAYKYGDEEQKQVLSKLSENFKKSLGEKKPDIFRQSQAMQQLLHQLKSPELAPKTYVPIENFATEQSAKTFGNAAFSAYKKFKQNAPLLSIENPPAGFALSTAEDLKNLIEKSREQFVKQAIKEGELSEKEAVKQAEKLIGATWDVGHINMLRGKGFKEKDIIEQSKTIAPFVKHVHLSDNFGFEHTELPMGMGNVPIKEIMQQLGEKGFEAKKIIEAGNWWQHFQTPPVVETMEAMGSPMYSAGISGPYWSQTIGLQQGYLGGYGMMLPQTNYETFGAGFSRLPAELGGQIPGAQGSRMSGHRME